MPIESPSVAMRLIALALGVAPVVHAGSYAGNPYSPTRGHAYRHGVVPTIDTWRKIREALPPVGGGGTGTPGTETNTLHFNGGTDGIGVLSGDPKVYLVAYGRQWGAATWVWDITTGVLTLNFSADPNGEAPRLQQFFSGLGTGGELWSGTMTQYCDAPLVAEGAKSCPAGTPRVRYPRPSVLAAIWYDDSTSAPEAATGNQLATEAIRAAAHFGNMTPASNSSAVYVILSPPGTNPDHYRGHFCAWHSYNGDASLTGGPVASSYGDIVFINLPYIPDSGAGCGMNFVNSGSAGVLDGVTITMGHEYAESLTNPTGGGWTSGSPDREDGDECAWIPPSHPGGAANVTMGNGVYAMQATWSNDTNGCAISHPVISTPGPSSNPNSVAFIDLLLH